MSRIFKKEVEKGFSLMSKGMGFKLKKYNFYKPISEMAHATLGFGMATHTDKGHIYVDVTIGVFHKDVEELLNKLTGYNSFDIMQPTIGTQIGYLMPGNSYKEWDFIENKDNSHLYDDILTNIQTYGFAYQEKMKDFDKLLEAFEKREPGIFNSARDRCLPILYYLKGDKQKGLKAIEAAIERQKQPFKESDLPKLSGEDVLTIIGPGIGKVDPEYLKFAEKYEAL